MEFSGHEFMEDFDPLPSGLQLLLTRMECPCYWFTLPSVVLPGEGMEGDTGLVGEAVSRVEV